MMLNKACFEIDYLGTTVVDRRFTSPMVPWVMADIKKRKKVLKIKLSIEDREVKGIKDNEFLFRHDIQKLVSFYYEPSNAKFFLYLIRQDSDPLLHCYLFEAPDFEYVVEIFHAMKENSREQVHWQKSCRSHSSVTSLTSLCPDISPSNSQFFEVLYVGKIKVSHRNVPITFVDEALEKIKLLELKKAKKLIGGNNLCKVENLNVKSIIRKEQTENLTVKEDKIPISNNGNQKNIFDHPRKLKSSFSHNDILVKVDSRSVTGISDNQIIYDITNQNIPTKNEGVTNAEGLVSLINQDDLKKTNNEMGFLRTRAGSLGVIETLKKKGNESSQNRTMLFYVGKTDLRLISPDRKQVLLHEKFKDVVSCIQGLQYSEHFGFICHEEDYYIAYLFKCESDSIADDIVSVITQSFHSIKEIKQPIPSCDHCPMVWFHRLCSELEGLNDKKIQNTILKRIETLPAEENEIIHTKYLGTESSNIKEQNEFLMILLRTHCEAKQIRHVHDTVENRSEFINQYLGGSAIFMKAKRSLTSSFDQLLKRKGSQLDNTLQESSSKEILNKKLDTLLHEVNSTGSHASTGATGKTESKYRVNPGLCENVKSQCHLEKSDENDTSKQSKIPNFPDIAVSAVDNKRKVEETIFQPNAEADKKMEDEPTNTPMLNIFLKVGSTTKSPPNDKILTNEMSPTSNGSWRQAIFHQVVTPEKCESVNGKIWRIRTKEELRDLWKKAINQQLLLIRMEKENARLRERQEEATVKRIKLEYDELGSLNKEYTGIWEIILNRDSRQIFSECDHQMMLQAVRQGIPPAKRGEVWHFLAVQYCLKQSSFDATDFPNYDVPYEDLLKQLTSFQHAILIDLGRTFPNHPYFSSPLGPGQLALFNLLKAYSLLDPQVGYCQGLSFIAGVLLLHMSEEAAFLLLKHLMFRRGLRKQYLPNMAALQVQLYQLTRLLYDNLPRLYVHFDRNEVAPTLYAAPWMLTLFASQFPLGFVTRVFDLLFLEHTTDIILRIILALLEEHMELLLTNSTFEEIMSYLKNEIPKMVGAQAEKIMKRVLTMDISERLHEYEVEYHVLQEEVSTSRPKLEELKKLELENKRLKDQNIKLIEQLEIANKNSNRFEKCWDTQHLVINSLEKQIHNLETTVQTLGDFISCICENHSEIEVPSDIRRVLSNLELAEFRTIKQVKNEFSFKKKSGKTSFLKKSHTSIGFVEEDNFHKAEDLNCDDSLNGPKWNEKSTPDVNNSEGPERNGKQKTTSIRGVPLRVIADENEEERKKTNSNSSNLTSKITSGVSFFFNTSQNQSKCNRDKGTLQENSSLANSKTSENFNNVHQTLKTSSKEIESLNIEGTAINGAKKDTLNKDTGKNSASDLTHLENSDAKSNPVPSDDTAIKFHPLDICNDVNITYNGTRKLKSIKSGPKLNRSNATISCE